MPCPRSGKSPDAFAPRPSKLEFNASISRRLLKNSEAVDKKKGPRIRRFPPPTIYLDWMIIDV